MNPEKNKLRIQNYPDTSGQELNALNLELKQRPGKNNKARRLVTCNCNKANLPS